MCFQIVSEYCIDMDSIHQTGRSNGGMLSYHLAAHIDRFPSPSLSFPYRCSFFVIFEPPIFNRRFASIGPVAGSPFLGYAQVPDRALSIIDFHGTADQTIPYSLPTSEGSGPDGTVISFDGYFYYDKPRVISSWAEGLDCGPALPWPTEMDGVQVLRNAWLQNFESQLRTSHVSSTLSAVEEVRWFTAMLTMVTTILLDLTG